MFPSLPLFTLHNSTPNSHLQFILLYNISALYIHVHLVKTRKIPLFDVFFFLMSMESMWNKKSMKTMGTSLYTVNNNIARIEQFLFINVSFVCGVCHCPYLMVFNVLLCLFYCVFFSFP